MSTELASGLPAMAVILPAAAGVLILAAGRFIGWFREVLAIAGGVAALVCSVEAAVEVLRGYILTSFGRQFYVDSLSALLLVLVSGITFLAVIYSLKYMCHEVHEGGPPQRTTPNRLTAFYGWLMLFEATMLWACVSNNIIMLYVAVEASTIASGLLVAFYWDKRSLEAGYKYLMLLTVGITFSLFGCELV